MESGHSSTMDLSLNSSRSAPTTTLGWLLYRFGLVVIGLLWVSLSCTLCGCGTMNGYVMNRSGKRYYQKGNYEFARYEFERALMDSPHNANYAFNVARTMELEGEYDNAEAMYQHALTINPNHMPSYHALAGMLKEQGRTAEAQELLVAWADTQPYSVDAQMSASQMHRQQGNPQAAQMHYQQAMRNMPVSRRQQRLANPYNPQTQMAMYGGTHQPSRRYPYSTAPSLQMAGVMPQTDPTMIGGPVVSSNTMASTQIYQQPLPAGSAWTPVDGSTIQSVPTPQQYLPSGEPHLLPEQSMPTSQTGPQAYEGQQFVSYPPVMQGQQAFIPGPGTTNVAPQQVMLPAGAAYDDNVQYEVGSYPSPPSVQGAPFQNISSTSVVPAVQAF